ncbi:hypothetical protein B0H11DRAFT_2310411 [Mycena galericulata]|nr:hypothetical protein B0H11DRAFT_2310411 [Mycena galericulata]
MKTRALAVLQTDMLDVKVTRALGALEAETDVLDVNAMRAELDKLEVRGTAALDGFTSRSTTSTTIAEERRTAQASASNTGATPVKSGGGTEIGLDKVRRAHVDLHLAQELHDRRSKSGDLVEALFGSLVNVEEANVILQELLRTKVLSVETQTGIKVLSRGHSAACDHAVAQARQAIAPVNPPLQEL